MNPATARPAYSARAGEAIRVFRNGDANFAIGCGRVTVARSHPSYVAVVVADFDHLVRVPEGEETLKAGDTIGHRIRIRKPELPTDPPNAWAVPDDLPAACAAGVALGRGADGGPRFGTGAGCGSTIVYDPADWPRAGDPNSPSSVEVLLRLLRQANLNAGGRSDPSKIDWGAEEAER
jgi:hypothetical protein